PAEAPQHLTGACPPPAARAAGHPEAAGRLGPLALAHLRPAVRPPRWPPAALPVARPGRLKPGAVAPPGPVAERCFARAGAEPPACPRKRASRPLSRRVLRLDAAQPPGQAWPAARRPVRMRLAAPAVARAARGRATWKPQHRPHAPAAR